jgi:hypothetical protein
MGKWLGGLIGTVLAGVLIYYLTTGMPGMPARGEHSDPTLPTPVSSPAPSAQHMSAPEPNTDRGHGDYKDVEVAGLDECLKVCLAETRCLAVSFNTASNQCWMKDSVPTRTTRPGFTSSVKYTE